MRRRLPGGNVLWGRLSLPHAAWRLHEQCRLQLRLVVHRRPLRRSVRARDRPVRLLRLLRGRGSVPGGSMRAGRRSRLTGACSDGRSSIGLRARGCRVRAGVPQRASIQPLVQFDLCDALAARERLE